MSLGMSAAARLNMPASMAQCSRSFSRVLVAGDEEEREGCVEEAGKRRDSLRRMRRVSR